MPQDYEQEKGGGGRGQMRVQQTSLEKGRGQNRNRAQPVCAECEGWARGGQQDTCTGSACRRNPGCSSE